MRLAQRHLAGLFDRLIKLAPGYEVCAYYARAYIYIKAFVNMSNNHILSSCVKWLLNTLEAALCEYVYLSYTYNGSQPVCLPDQSASLFPIGHPNIAQPLAKSELEE